MEIIINYKKTPIIILKLTNFVDLLGEKIRQKQRIPNGAVRRHPKRVQIPSKRLLWPSYLRSQSYLHSNRRGQWATSAAGHPNRHCRRSNVCQEAAQSVLGLLRAKNGRGQNGR